MCRAVSGSACRCRARRYRTGRSCPQRPVAPSGRAGSTVASARAVGLRSIAAWYGRARADRAGGQRRLAQQGGGQALRPRRFGASGAAALAAPAVAWCRLASMSAAASAPAADLAGHYQGKTRAACRTRQRGRRGFRRQTGGLAVAAVGIDHGGRRCRLPTGRWGEGRLEHVSETSAPT